MKITLLAAFAVMALIGPMVANSWDPSVSLGGKSNGSPSAVVWGPPSNISVFVRGLDDGLWWNTTPNNGQFKWGGWKSIGGKISSSPSCVASTNSRIDCYARAGADNALWAVTYQDIDIGKWGRWHSLGGGLNGAPSASRWGLGHDVVFARGSLNNELYQIEIGGGVAGQYSSNGGATVTDPGCAALADDETSRRVACYSMGTPLQMFQYASLYAPTSDGDHGNCFLCLGGDPFVLAPPQPDGTQKTWVQVDGQTPFPPSLIYADGNSHDVYATGTATSGNVLWHRAWRAQGGWRNWENLGGVQLASGPSCIRTGTISAAQTMCFAQAVDGSVTMRWNH
jgi:hypothetical protein